jgi:hypothetical protein
MDYKYSQKELPKCTAQVNRPLYIAQKYMAKKYNKKYMD